MPKAASWTMGLALTLGLALSLAFALPPGAASAQEARPMAEDPALEARVMAVAEELRCMVCQNETIAASHADLARDLRGQVREQLRQGRTPQQVIDFMVERYGDFVLYRPPLRAGTVLLWGGPFALLLVAAAWLVPRVRRQPALAGDALSPDEARRVRQLLDEERAR